MSAAMIANAPFIPPRTSATGNPTAMGCRSTPAFNAPIPPMACARMSCPPRAEVPTPPVGHRHQPPHHVEPNLRFEIHRDAPLVPVEGQERGVVEIEVVPTPRVGAPAVHRVSLGSQDLEPLD